MPDQMPDFFPGSGVFLLFPCLFPREGRFFAQKHRKSEGPLHGSRTQIQPPGGGAGSPHPVPVCPALYAVQPAAVPLWGGRSLRGGAVFRGGGSVRRVHRHPAHADGDSPGAGPLHGRDGAHRQPHRGKGLWRRGPGHRHHGGALCPHRGGDDPRHAALHRPGGRAHADAGRGGGRLRRLCAHLLGGTALYRGVQRPLGHFPRTGGQQDPGPVRGGGLCGEHRGRPAAGGRPPHGGRRAPPRPPSPPRG